MAVLVSLIKSIFSKSGVTNQIMNRYVVFSRDREKGDLSYFEAFPVKI
jgi:CRISPR/Cas system CMR subunit Cmr6 (Cas7 group RAMP superfamily)